jgi:hypothetical protein
MEPKTYGEFRELREGFRSRVETWSKRWPTLKTDQQALADRLGYGYAVETPIVYNTALDRVGPQDEIGIVLVGDNPGLNEQRADRMAYLVGQSGRLAEGMFKRELGIDFRRSVLILNKTPLHTPKTKELGALQPSYSALLEESQRYMAGLCLDMARALGAAIWITGYSELGPKGLFSAFSEEFSREARLRGFPLARILVFRHFSMNQFSGDLKKKRSPGEDAMQALERLGSGYRAEKLGL